MRFDIYEKAQNAFDENKQRAVDKSNRLLAKQLAEFREYLKPENLLSELIDSLKKSDIDSFDDGNGKLEDYDFYPQPPDGWMYVSDHYTVQSDIRKLRMQGIVVEVSGSGPRAGLNVTFKKGT